MTTSTLTINGTTIAAGTTLAARLRGVQVCTITVAEVTKRRDVLTRITGRLDDGRGVSCDVWAIGDYEGRGVIHGGLHVQRHDPRYVCNINASQLTLA